MGGRQQAVGLVKELDCQLFMFARLHTLGHPDTPVEMVVVMALRQDLEQGGDRIDCLVQYPAKFPNSFSFRHRGLIWQGTPRPGDGFGSWEGHSCERCVVRGAWNGANPYQV